MSVVSAFVGGCLCGALRYGARVAPLDVGYCHCRLCQRSTGAPVLVWATFPVEGFDYLKGKPAIYRSSQHGQREFCASCGTQIAYRETVAPRSVDVNAATLDEPGRVEPRCHVWWDSRIPWFDTRDDLPRHRGDGPDEAA